MTALRNNGGIPIAQSRLYFSRKANYTFKKPNSDTYQNWAFLIEGIFLINRMAIMALVLR